MRVHYKIDFYTGYDYESYVYSPENFPYNPYVEPEEEEEGDNEGEENGTVLDDDDTSDSKPTSSATQTRIEKRVPRNLLTRKAK